ncbi:MAG: molecular chaperone TorD family protein [Deltaproteobacteria bacterium]|nr:molecular chaperone TorD family protein [Deltaproteobacteria bacterium]
MKALLGTNAKINEVDLVLCRATLYGALALGFRPPTEETMARLVSEEGTSALADAAIVLDGDHELELARHVKTLALAGATTVEDLFASYRRIFGHTASSLVPPYETEYGTEAVFQQPLELGDLMGFYRAFGLTLNPAEHERADHVSCECEFLSFLALKEAYALEKGDLPMQEEIRKATRLFLRDHLARFVPTCARRLSREDRGGFYSALGDLCSRFISKECARFTLPVGTDNLGLRPAADNRIPMACGSDTACPAMPGACRPAGEGEE